MQTVLNLSLEQEENLCAGSSDIVVGARYDIKELLEPRVTEDGRLVVARTARSTFEWQGQVGTWDIVYAVAPKSAAQPIFKCEQRRQGGWDFG